MDNHVMSDILTQQFTLYGSNSYYCIFLNSFHVVQLLTNDKIIEDLETFLSNSHFDTCERV